MNREIKFRVWDKERNKMYFEKHTVPRVLKGYLSGINGDGLACNDFNYDRYEIMQYTGLKDRNGKEIYIGDILATSNDEGADIDKWEKDDHGFTAVNEGLHKLGLFFTNWCPDPYDEDSIYSIRYVDVIGNIYENPELLKSL